MARERGALRTLDEAVALLDGNPAETANLAAALLNRSFAHLNAGHVRRARADLTWCRRVATDEGYHMIAAKALHNLGYCDLLAGDIPAALQLFNAAASAYRPTAPGFPSRAGRRTRPARCSRSASPATRPANWTARWPRSGGSGSTTISPKPSWPGRRPRWATGELAAASRWAAAAERRFRRRGNEAWADLAALTRLRARLAQPGRRARIPAEAPRLAGRLRGRGLADDADMAELIAARALAAAGRTDEARRRLAVVRRRGRTVPLDVSLLRRLARAELAEREGRPGAALAELRAGLALVQARRDRLGSIDLQTGTAALGAELAAAGLRLALERGSAPLVFAWLERSRAQAFRVRPVRPPADPQAEALLAELRQLSYLIREAELNGSRDPAMASRHAELRRAIKEHDWQASGLGHAAVLAGLGDVSAALEHSGQTLVAILGAGRPDGRGGSAARIGAPGAARRLRDRRRGGPAAQRRPRHAGRTAAAGPARDRDQGVDPASGGHADGRDHRAAARRARRRRHRVRARGPAGQHSLGLAARPARPPGHRVPVRVHLAGRLRGRGRPRRTRGRTDRRCYWPGRTWSTRPGRSPRSPSPIRAAARCSSRQATVRAALQALDGAPLAHLAAHGHHDQENFLFSRVDLADGPLMAYDIQQLTAAPRHVVLSSCDVGRTVVRPGEEILGFTAALLYIGTATVTASVTRVGDDDAVGMMTAYHRLLAAGTRPAEALAAATAGDPFSPFVCFGAG